MKIAQGWFYYSGELLFMHLPDDLVCQTISGSSMRRMDAIYLLTNEWMNMIGNGRNNASFPSFSFPFFQRLGSTPMHVCCNHIWCWTDGWTSRSETYLPSTRISSPCVKGPRGRRTAPWRTNSHVIRGRDPLTMRSIDERW